MVLVFHHTENSDLIDNFVCLGKNLTLWDIHNVSARMKQDNRGQKGDVEMLLDVFRDLMSRDPNAVVSICIVCAFVVHRMLM